MCEVCFWFQLFPMHLFGCPVGHRSHISVEGGRGEGLGRAGREGGRGEGLGRAGRAKRRRSSSESVSEREGGESEERPRKRLRCSERHR